MKRSVATICALLLALNCTMATAASIDVPSFSELKTYGVGTKSGSVVLASENFDAFGTISDSNTSPNRCEDIISTSTTSNLTWANNQHGSSTTQVLGTAENGYRFRYYATKAARCIETITLTNPISSGLVEFEFSIKLTNASKKLNFTKSHDGSAFSSLIKFDNGKIYVNGSETAETTTFASEQNMKVKLVIDFDKSLWNAYIDGSRIGTENMAWTSNKTFKSMRFDFIDTNNYGFAFELDDLKFTKIIKDTVSSYEPVSSYDFESGTTGVTGINATGSFAAATVDGRNVLKISSTGRVTSGIYRVQLPFTEVTSGRVGIDYDVKSNGRGESQLCSMITGTASWVRYLSITGNGNDEQDSLYTSRNRCIPTRTDLSNLGSDIWGSLSPNEWHKIHVEFDIDKGTMDLAVDGEAAFKNAQLSTDGNASGVPASIKGLEIFHTGIDGTNEENPSELYIDNVKFYKINTCGEIKLEKSVENFSNGAAFAPEGWTAENATISQSAVGGHFQNLIKIDGAEALSIIETPAVDLSSGVNIIDFKFASELNGSGSVVSIGEQEIIKVEDGKLMFGSNIIAEDRLVRDMRIVLSGTSAKLYIGDIYKAAIVTSAFTTSEKIKFTAQAGNAVYVGDILVREALDDHYEIVRTPITINGREMTTYDNGAAEGISAAGVTVYNYTASDVVFNIPATVIATYDSNGRLHDVALADSVAAAPDGSYYVSADAVAGGRVKAFLFEDIDNIIPASDSIEIK